MKIGILSLKYESNFGGILQSVALQNVLEKMGHQIEIINYSAIVKESKWHDFIFRIFNLLFTGNIFVSLKEKRKEQKKNTGKDSLALIENNEIFMSKNLHRSQLLNEFSISSYCKDFDCVIVGSDQVWSVTNASKLVYFFDWEYFGKKIAYSACSVNRQPAFLNRKKVKYLLNKFDAVSVRDEVTRNFVYSTSGINPIVVADPTLLFDFDPLLENRIIPEPYIVIYILGKELRGGNKLALESIKKRCTANTKVVAIIIPSVSIEGVTGADIVIDDCDPLRWINLIKYAEFVFTDSFHGVVFALKYRKRFLAYYSFAKRATRLLDLNDRYNIGNIVKDVSEVDVVLESNKIPDYDRIEEHIKDSINYLHTIL